MPLNAFEKRMRNRFLFCLIGFLFLSYHLFSQEQKRDFTALFYNTENLFDTKDEPGRDDDEFTPGEARHWTNKKLNQKLVNISKVIISSSGFEIPDVVALCEIENRGVLDRLLSNTPLKNSNYKIIHKESPDHRGIDLALLYNPDSVYPLEYKFYPLQNQGDTVKSREILYFSGIAKKTDTLHFFVNHWPSRYDGLLESKPLRNLAANILKEKIKELQQRYRTPKIILLGDFNDQPSNESISKFLNARPVSGKAESNQLYNLSYPWMKNEIGTLKYQSQWSVFDQIIVSGSLIDNDKGYSVVPGNTNIVSLPFLLENDERYGGVKPFRTYYGYSYEGGFSDHLPIQIKLVVPD